MCWKVRRWRAAGKSARTLGSKSSEIPRRSPKRFAGASCSRQAQEWIQRRPRAACPQAWSQPSVQAAHWPVVLELPNLVGLRCCPLQGPRFCDRDHIDERSHFNAAGFRDNYTITRDTGNDISVKPNLSYSLEVRSLLKNK